MACGGDGGAVPQSASCVDSAPWRCRMARLPAGPAQGHRAATTTLQDGRLSCGSGRANTPLPWRQGPPLPWPTSALGAKGEVGARPEQQLRRPSWGGWRWPPWRRGQAGLSRAGAPQPCRSGQQGLIGVARGHSLDDSTQAQQRWTPSTGQHSAASTMVTSKSAAWLIACCTPGESGHAAKASLGEWGTYYDIEVY